jgi:hypothetical protein
MRVINYKGIPHNFPDEMSDDDINKAMSKTYADDIYEAKGGGIVSSLKRGVKGLVANAQIDMPEDLRLPGQKTKEEMFREVQKIPGSPIAGKVAEAYTNADGFWSGLGAAGSAIVDNAGQAIDYTVEQIPGALLGGGAGGKVMSGVGNAVVDKIITNPVAQEFAKKALIGSGVNAGATGIAGLPQNIVGNLDAGMDFESAQSEARKSTAAETAVAGVTGLAFPLGGEGLGATTAKVLGLQPVDEMAQTIAGNLATGEETTGGELVASALLGIPMAPVEIGSAYYVGRKNETADKKIQEELGAQAVEETVSNNGSGESTSIHEMNETKQPLPRAIPLYTDASTGELTNMVIEGQEPTWRNVKGANVKLIDGTVEQALDSGELALSDEIRSELQNNNFSDPARAKRLAAEMELMTQGIETVFEIDENGRTVATDIVGKTVEQLAQEFEALKSETGLPVSLAEKVPSLNSFINEEIESEISPQDTLAYRMLNPMTAEKKALAQQKMRRIEEGKNLPPDPNKIDTESLDSIWEKEVGRTFADAREESADPDSGGITDDVATARAERFEPNSVPPSQRVIDSASVDSAVGLTLEQIPKQAGTFGIGGNARSFPQEYKDAITSFGEAIRKRYMSPDAMLVINFENFAPTRDIYGKVKLDESGSPMSNIMGAHFRTGDGTHVITPRELASFDVFKDSYNPLTVNEAIGSFTHEMGHAIWLNEFMNGVDKGVAMRLTNAIKTDDLTAIQEMLSELPSDRAEVLQEFLNAREEVKTQSAEWFVENWIGTRKMALGVGKRVNTSEQNIYAWAKRELAKSGKRWEGATALELIEALGGEKYILNFNEYMAEQFSRAAYKKDLAGEVLGNNAFFKRALDMLRNFFRMLKTTKGQNAEAIVAPGVKFEEWLDGLSALRSQMKDPKPKRKRTVKAKAKANEAVAEPLITPALPEVKVTRVSEADEINAEEVRKSFARVVPLVRRIDEYEAERLADAIESGAWEEAQMIVRETLDREINFDKTYTTQLLKSLPMKANYNIRMLTGLANQSFVRKQDKRAIQELVELATAVGQEQVSRESVVTMLLADVVPLTMEFTTEFAGENSYIGRIGRDKFSAETVVFKQDKINTFFPTHFNADTAKPGEIIAHIRFLRNRDVAEIFELQSDPLQKLNRKGKLEQSNQTYAEIFPEDKAKLEDYSSRWEERVLRDFNGEMVERGFKSVRIAHPNVMGLAEGWLSESDFPFKITELQLESIKGLPAPDAFGTQPTLTGLVHVMANRKLHFQTINNAGDLSWTRLANNVKSTLSQNPAERDLVIAAQNNGRMAVDKASKNINVPEDMKGIYRRHADLVDYARKAFGAIDVMDEAGNPWVEYSVKDDMSEVVSWDASSPQGMEALKVVSSMAKFKDKAINKATNFMMKAGLASTQLQQMASTNKDIVPLQLMNKMQLSYGRLKSRLLFQPQEVVKAWLNLGKEQTKTLEKLLLAEEAAGEHFTELVQVKGQWTHQNSAKFEAWLKSKGVDTSTEFGAEIRDTMIASKNSHQYQFNVLEAVLRDVTWKKYNRDTAVLSEKWAEYVPIFQQMREKPFLPTMQYGNFVLYVTNKEEGGGRAKTIYRKHFESKADRDAAFVQFEKNARLGEKIHTKDLTEAQAVTLAIPFDFLQAVSDSQMYSKDQIMLLQELLIPNRVSKFEKRWNQLSDKTPGSSDNLFRNFTAFSLNNANFIAKLRYNQEFSRALAGMRSEIKALDSVNMDPQLKLDRKDKLSGILREMTSVKQYLMHPPAEYEVLRSAVSLLQLSFMIKTAIMNTSTMLHTMHAAMVEHGERAGMQAFLSSIGDIKAVWGSTKKGGSNTLDTRIKEAKTEKEKTRLSQLKFAMDRAVHEGIIDQSFAYMLAGMAQSGTRMKIYQEHPGMAKAFGWLDAGMTPFRNVEKVNRITNLLTFYKLEVAKGTEVSKAYDIAAEKTLLLQNDYTGGNRPRLLRGGADNPITSKTPILTIFLSYAQFMGWMMTGGYDRSLQSTVEARGETYKGSTVNFTARMWLSYLVLGGVMGLPFAENIMDVLQWIARKFGIASTELELRKLISEVTSHENLVMHGILHNVPTPFGGIDLSGSFGLGRMMPGVEPLATMDTMRPAEAIGREVLALAGPFGSLVKSAMDFTAAEGTTESLKALPGILGKIGSALSAYENGIMTRGGVRLNKDENGEFVKQDAGLAALQIAGFNPAEASAQRQRNNLAFEITQYYMNKQSGLLRMRNLAIIKQEPIGEIEARILDFNKSLPKEFAKDLKITQKTKVTSLKSFKGRIKKAEAGEAPTKKYRRVYELVEEVSQ